MELDITQVLKDTENALRDFISNILRKKFGENWVEQCGISPERIEQWQSRKAEEEKRQKFGVVEERLIYYADFYDLKTLLKKKWGEFTEALGDWKTMDVWLDQLGMLRDPDAHRRELLPHQKHLAIGIAGEIRTRLVRYRSKQETSEDYYPRIESVRDNYGNIWTIEKGDRNIDIKTTLRPNDILNIIITATDHLGEDLEYGIITGQTGILIFPYKTFLTDSFWQDENTISIKILDENIGKNFFVSSYVRSLRKYHAFKHYDDSIGFSYEVLPPKK